MKWHHIIGLVGGVFLVTWVFSGWMSMSPWGGFKDNGAKAIEARYVGARSGFVPVDLAAVAKAAPGAHELQFGYLGGKAIIDALGGPAGKRVLDAATAQPLHPSTTQIEALARSALPGATLASSTLLDRYDLYWYSAGNPRADERPLPVLRLAFADPARTWLHIDPETGELLGQSGSGRRTYRWLFSALHSFDLPWLLLWPLLRQALMWILSAAGLAISVSGVVIGWRHLRRPKPGARRALPGR